ncbi:putative outer membrane starch-binding protein [Pontibacter ummariensis]|uniref:Starch-binding associating with outer membrane n=1 Tax=Pontibacter ummariensis TaxID=1610492 RepID=A0A239L3Q2_9BACT|nr:RagB/SusD family nutrient uptake outer membrane protein [Pontibacter ummariensis]PRY04306.1 putative outer membrane starch-binding protein [Pontibacter ummariensis]SNT25081.1 Starch-binding associating with outer membrane [Pontibacter ummariensis]
MRRYLSTIKYVLGISLVLGVTGCSDQLDEVQPQTSLNRDLILSDPNAAMTLYYGVYGSFRSYHNTLFTLGEMRSEIWADGLFTESEDGGLRNYYTHNIDANNVPAANWAGFYSLLDKINTAIKLFPQAPVPEDQKSRVLAEMHGLRAFVYYTMLKTWGGVPLSTEPVTQVGGLEDLYRERATPEAVMEQVKADIEQSLTLFSGDNALTASFTGTSKHIYWNRAATLTLKGDAYIWSGTHMGGGGADFATAQQALEEVTTIGGLGLVENYADLFNPAREANNREIIFAISYEKDEATAGVYSSFRVNTTQASTLLLDPLTNPRTVSQAYPFLAGASRVGMSESMIEKLQHIEDERVNATFEVMYRNVPPTYPIAGVLLTKFAGREDAGVQLYDIDFPVYRYADVLLLLAEAKAKQGMDPSVEINLIRERAYGSDYVPYTDGSQQEDLRAILEEDLREFIGEGKRWWSLRRAGDEWVFEYVDPVYLASEQAYKLLLPISVGMLNSDPKLKQTPGY